MDPVLRFWKSRNKFQKKSNRNYFFYFLKILWKIIKQVSNIPMLKNTFSIQKNSNFKERPVNILLSLVPKALFPLISQTVLSKNATLISVLLLCQTKASLLVTILALFPHWQYSVASSILNLHLFLIRPYWVYSVSIEINIFDQKVQKILIFRTKYAHLVLIFVFIKLSRSTSNVIIECSRTHIYSNKHIYFVPC